MKKETIFLYIVLFIGLLIGYKTIKLPYKGVIDVEILQNTEGIADLDQKRKISGSHHITTDTIAFKRSRVLEHKRYGNLGYRSNFYIEFDVDMDVKRDGLYHFYIASDDGFRLFIDKKNVCEHPGDRPYTTTTCPIELTKGAHNLHLSYFQGGGPLGIAADYAYGGTKRYLVGKNSKFIEFKESK